MSHPLPPDSILLAAVSASLEQVLTLNRYAERDQIADASRVRVEHAFHNLRTALERVCARLTDDPDPDLVAAEIGVLARLHESQERIERRGPNDLKEIGYHSRIGGVI